MRALTIHRPTVLALLAAAGVAAAAPSVASARPIGDTAPKKDCKLPGGNPIRSGSNGRVGGVEYNCSDGIACQVENGRTTDKCSHAERTIVVVKHRPFTGASAVTVTARR